MSGLQPGRVVVVMSSFSDSIVFAVLTGKTAFSNSSNSTVLKSFLSGERFRNDPFSLIAVSGTKQCRFSFENGVEWTGSLLNAKSQKLKDEKR